MSSVDLNADPKDPIHVPFESKQVFATDKAAGKPKAKPQILTSHMARIFKVANNEHQSVETRVNRLKTLATDYRSPTRFTGLRAHSAHLASVCDALVQQFISVEKAKSGSKDHGAIDGSDQRKISTMTVADQTGAVKA